MTDHPICDACECVSHCRKNGCIPVTPMPTNSAPKVVQEQYNPWREFIENVISGDNYFRAGEYYELLAYIDGLLAANADYEKTPPDHFAGEVEASREPEKPALPLSTSVTSLKLELSAALEMAVRDRMLVKEKDALILTLASALGGLMDLECRDRIMPTGREWDAARAALSKVPQ